MKRYFELESALENIRKEAEETIKVHLHGIFVKDEESEIRFHEHDISSPVHISNEDGNLASTICSISADEEKGFLVFGIPMTKFEFDIVSKFT
jgi:hypothetical protein